MGWKIGWNNRMTNGVCHPRMINSTTNLVSRQLGATCLTHVRIPTQLDFVTSHLPHRNAHQHDRLPLSYLASHKWYISFPIPRADECDSLWVNISTWPTNIVARYLAQIFLILYFLVYKIRIGCLRRYNNTYHECLHRIGCRNNRALPSLSLIIPIGSQFMKLGFMISIWRSTMLRRKKWYYTLFKYGFTLPQGRCHRSILLKEPWYATSLCVLPSPMVVE